MYGNAHVGTPIGEAYGFVLIAYGAGEVIS
jgi:hypothetical protein